jgi:hypothetical protein
MKANSLLLRVCRKSTSYFTRGTDRDCLNMLYRVLGLLGLLGLLVLLGLLGLLELQPCLASAN